MRVELYYDKECPFCRAYAKFLIIKKKHELIVFNARENKDQIDELREEGFDINKGFIIRVDATDIYQGADAIVFLNGLTKNKLYFPDNYFFRTIIYSMIKYLRKFILYITFKNSDI